MTSPMLALLYHLNVINQRWKVKFFNEFVDFHFTELNMDTLSIINLRTSYAF